MWLPYGFLSLGTGVPVRHLPKALGVSEERPGVGSGSASALTGELSEDRGDTRDGPGWVPAAFGEDGLPSDSSVGPRVLPGDGAPCLQTLPRVTPHPLLLCVDPGPRKWRGVTLKKKDVQRQEPARWEGQPLRCRCIGNVPEAQSTASSGPAHQQPSAGRVAMVRSTREASWGAPEVGGNAWAPTHLSATSQ